MNSIQKYPHIIELSACILNMFVFMFSCPVNILTSFGIYSALKLSKEITSLFDTYKVIQCVPTSEYSSRFITYVSLFYFFS